MLSADQLLASLWRRKISFLLTFLLVLGAVAGVTYSLPKAYSSEAYVLVVAGARSGSDFEATQTNQVVLKTYAELLQTRGVAEEVSEALPFDHSVDAVQASVSVTPITQSQLIRIAAEASSPRRAQELTGTYAEVFVDRASDLTDELGTNIRVAVGEGASFQEAPVRPRPRLYLAVGALIAALLAAGVALLRERLDQRLEITSSTTEILGLPILARIPDHPKAPDASLLDDAITGARPAMLREAFSLLITNIAFLEQGERPHALAVVSAGEGEGKSTCCLGLARAADTVGATVLLVDGDLRRPRLSRMLDGDDPEQPGLSDALSGGPLPDPRTLSIGDRWHGLSLLPAGAAPDNPVALIGSGLRRLDRWARSEFDLVVYDTPPISVGADGTLIASSADATLLVIDARRTRRAALAQAVEQLQRVHVRVMGVVVNRADDVSDASSKYYMAAQKRRKKRARSSS